MGFRERGQSRLSAEDFPHPTPYEVTLQRSLGYLVWLAVEECGGTEVITQAALDALRMRHRFHAPRALLDQLSVPPAQVDPTRGTSTASGARGELEKARASHDRILGDRAENLVQSAIAGSIGAYGALCDLTTFHRLAFPARFPTELARCVARAAYACCVDHADHGALGS